MMKKSLLSVLPLLALLMATGATWAQQTSGTIATMKALRGYMQPITGERIDYNCFNPLSTTALLTRCTDGSMAIEWETEPVPDNTSGEALFFKWIASYSTMTAAGDRSFDLFVNGKKSFVIKTTKGVNPSGWTLKGDDGLELSFELVREDAARDANGYMLLKVPGGRYTPGDPLRLRLVGEKASSSDWFMTFMYDLRPVDVSVMAVPFLSRKQSALQQAVYVAVSYLGERGKAVIAVDNGRKERKDLRRGANVFEFSVPAVTGAKEIPVQVAIDGADARTFTVLLKPVAQRTIHLLPHSHNDIGYTDLQTEVMKKQVKNIVDALGLIRQTASYPPEARFKWNVEALWGLEIFLKEATEAQRKEFVEAVKAGSINIEGLYLNMLTGLMRPEEFYRLTEFARSLREKHGINVTSAMISDVPGMTWNMIPTLADAGIRYFSSGPNGPYTGGDRTGHTNGAWADRPFYWVGPSGNARILYWMTGFGYGSFFAGLAGQTTANISFLRNFSRYFDWLDEISYPYDMIHMRHTVGGDNGTVDPELSEGVRRWNERYVSPKIVVSTTEATFAEFERKYGAVLPAFSGDFTPYWEDGAASSAFELGMNRNTAEELLQTEALYAMLAPGKYDRKKLYDAWTSVLFFNEHTWGAHNSITDPDSSFVTEQWDLKKDYATNAARMSSELRSQILASDAGQTPSNTVEVLNTNSWERTDLVVLPKAASMVGDIVKDEGGKEVPSQRLTNGDLAFLAAGVPPLGAKRYRVQAGKPSFTSNLRLEGRTIRDDNLEVVLDGETGAIRYLRTLSPAVEFVDSTKGSGVNEYLYVQGIDAREALTDSKVSVTVREQGPLVASLVVTSTAPGCRSLTREVRVISGLRRVDLVNTIDKKKVRDKEAVHFGFPFAVSDAVTRIDLGYGVVRPEADQLAGACRNYYSAQRWVDVSNQRHGVTLTVAEAPLIEVGEMHSELPSPRNVAWKTWQRSSSWIGSYVMNNYWHTNYKADQEGISSYRYSILPHGLFNLEQVTRWGIERSQPLLVRQVEADIPKSTSLFGLTSGKIIAIYVKPVDGGGHLVRLFNAGAAPDTVRFTFTGAGRSVYMSSPFEEKGKIVSEIALPAYGIATVRLDGEAVSHKGLK